MDQDNQSVKALGIVGIAVLLADLMAMSVNAQELHTVKCQGYFWGMPATVEGQRAYFRSGHPLGDGDSLRFNGVIRSSRGTLQFTYEGYANSAPFQGVVQTPQGPYLVKVLDGTGARHEKMVIYGGRPTLGPPPTWGEFVCSWR